MMLSPNGRFLWISTRRCGTGSFYAELSKRNWKRLGGANVEGFGDSPNEHPIPTKRMAEMHITVCRHPYDRALSIWKWSKGDLTFRQFLRKYLMRRGKCEFKDPYMLMPCAEFHDRFPHDRVIRLEDMPDAFEELTGVRLDWTRKRRATKHFPPGDLSWCQRRKLQRWAKVDFERYGYRI